MPSRTWTWLALSMSLAATAHAPSTSIPPANQPLTGPPAALERLASAYRGLSPTGIDAVLAGDYRFHAAGETRESLVRFAAGTSRETEMAVVRNMLRGVTHAGDKGMPRADSVGMSFDGISEGVDPEHPDSTQHYRVLTVTRAEFNIRLSNGDYLLNQPSMHVFHLVRGDAAVLAPGQAADPERWYIRRWLEDVSGLRLALGKQKGDCGEAEAETGEPAAPTALGICPLTNPACAALHVACDLPGTEPAQVEVFDVSGRLVNSKRLAVRAAGRVELDAGAGARLLPGVYWVRLRQAALRPSTRMVVVAR